MTTWQDSDLNERRSWYSPRPPARRTGTLAGGRGVSPSFLILADGFYEWKGEKGEKQPMFITLPDQAPFAFAGLWETWQSKESPEEPYRSCTIITREAAGVMTELHHRMPVILSLDAYAAWLDAGNTTLETLTEILQHKALIDLAYYPVTKQVNSVHRNEPANIQRV